MSSNEPGAKPTYIYKLVPSSSPPPPLASLPSHLPVSALDQSSGFIHLSTALQVPETLRRFFKDESKVYVLRIDYENVERDIRWEDPKAEVCGPRAGEGMFPVCLNSLDFPRDMASLMNSMCSYINWIDQHIAPVQRVQIGKG